MEVIDGVLPFLNTAERPAILAGRGTVGLGPLLLNLAAQWESGIALTMPAKGVVSGAHPLVLGGLGPGGSEASHQMLVEADLLLIAGATWWPEFYLPEHLKIVQLDTIPENIGGKIPVTYGVEPRIVQINTAAPVFPGLVSQLTRENRSKKEGYLTWV
jgi:pyruvate oxidase